MSRPRNHKISDPKQLLAVASPIRAQIVSIMENRDEYSVREISEHLGRPAEKVYYHVHQLVKAGLLQKGRQRPCTTRHEATYHLLAERVGVDFSIQTPAFRSALKKAVRVAHRLSERMVLDAIDNDSCRLDGPSANVRIHQESVRLSKPKLRELTAMLIEVDRFVMENNDPTRETTYVVTAALAPILANG